ncbi:MAG: VWA domain-containing protein [Candidatus Cohnella colombiensis]|uniref:VWA domain-containing protein n=1 Tax=Candidatus Cohnella colombiensis TaxID=3121368 RepID=A0AA95F0V1_9BACL|nr:MAG: VWA domain-containing protein [Cohnella sp.]
MFCTNCGKENLNHSPFCTNCGHLQEVPPIELNTTQLIKETPATTLEIEPANEPENEATVVAEILPPNSAEISPESPITPTSSPRSKKGLLVGLASVAVVVISSLWLLGVFSPKEELSAAPSPSSEVTPSPSEQASAEVNIPTTLDTLTITKVDNSSFPTIKLLIDVGGASVGELSAEDFTILEDGVTLPVSDIQYDKGNQALNVSYASLQFHRNPGQQDPRQVSLTLLGKQSESQYDAPQPLSLRMGDISYNTDQYPEVNVYFSLYDAFDKLVETIPSDNSLFQVAENNAPQQISSISKMSDIDESLSINLVMDDSGSMDQILSRVQQEALQFLDQITITENDRIGFMSFAGASEIVQSEFTNQTSAIVPQIKRLSAAGQCTALYRAIEQAVYNTAYNGESGSKYIVIFTDGGENCSNDGYENQDFISPQTVINTAKQFGIPIYAVGVDQDDQLQAITVATNGQYISIGSDIEKLGQFYQSIFTTKKAQYVVKYRSDSPQKQPRSTSIKLLNEAYSSKQEVTVTPRLIDEPAVARVMENYQVNWSVSMSSGDISYLVPYVTYDTTSKKAVYKVVNDQLVALNDAKSKGSVTTFGVPIYHLIDAKKVSESLYQLQLKKYFKRTIAKQGVITDTRFKSTAYTYNIVKQNGVWLVDSTEESNSSETCYTDDTYSTIVACK